MAEETGLGASRPQQLSLNVPVQVEVDRGGQSVTIQVILSNEWSVHLGAAPPDRIALRIVLLTRPASPAEVLPQSNRVFVCIPSEPLSAAAIAETRTEYRVDAPAAPWVWSPGQVEALSRGTVLAAGGSTLNAAGLFLERDAGSFLQRFAALAQAEQIRAQVRSMETYPEGALPKKTDEEIYLDRLSIQEQLSAGTIAETPTLWPSVKALFDLFKEKYARAYVRHHRAYRSEVTALERQLAGAEGNAKVLRLLDGISELGDPVGGAALVAYERLAASVRACSRSEQELSDLGEAPSCPTCRVPLDATPPTAEVETVLAGLTSALAQQQRRLSAEAVRQVLAEQREANIDQFLKVLQAADASALAQVLDEELAGFLKKLLGEVIVDVPLTTLVREIAERFPTVAEEQVSDFIAAVESSLRRELEKAQASHAGKKIRLRIV